MVSMEVVEPAATTDPAIVIAERSHLWRRILHFIGALVASVLLGFLAFYLSTRNNDFPVQYHPDEWSKIAQVRGDKEDWNFNHPLLMLHAARLYCNWFAVPDHPRSLSNAGRSTSAILVGIGVVAFSLAAWMQGGFAALLLAGAAIAMCPSLIVHGHYFKEDTSLVFGISVTVLGAAMHCASRHWWTRVLAAVVLGAGCALAMSGKYVGVATVIPALLALLISPIRYWWITVIQIVMFIVVGGALGMWINSEAFEDPWNFKLRDDVQSHVEDQYDHATASEWMHGQVVLRTPGFFCVRMAARQIPLVLWTLAAIALLAWACRPWCSRWMISLAMLILTYAVVLAYDAIPIPRYALPLTVLTSFALAQIVAAVIMKRSKQWRWAVIGIAIVALFAVNLRACLKLNRQFADDSRQRLREWIATSLPRGALIVGERYTGLDNNGDPWRFPNSPRLTQLIFPCNFAGDFRSVENLRQRKINYLVVAEPAYGRFLYPESTAGAGQERRYRETREFYERLFREMKPIWQSDPDPPSDSYVNPAIRVYEITPPKRNP